MSLPNGYREAWAERSAIDGPRYSEAVRGANEARRDAYAAHGWRPHFHDAQRGTIAYASELYRGSPVGFRAYLRTK